MLGRMVETKLGVAPNTTLELGANYKAGIYYLQMVQGNRKRTIKLLKQ